MAKAVLLVVALIVSACQFGNAAQDDKSLVVGESLMQHPGLRRVVDQYYSAEKARDWRITYGLRPVAFQKVVPFDVYQREMDKGSAGWNLIRVEILTSTQSANDEVVVMLKFHESFDTTVAKSRFDGRVSNGTTSRSEETIWRRDGASWKSIQPGQRGHLPLNDRLVY